jgi:hypothetical protein
MARPRLTAAAANRPADTYDTRVFEPGKEVVDSSVDHVIDASGERLSRWTHRHRRDIITFTAYVLLTLLLTWPQVAELQSVPRHQDPLFSIWRLAWIGRALSTAPDQLFNGNNYYPTRGTLLFSDATLVQGLLAWPFVRLGVPLPSVYNVLVLASFVASAWAMWLLAFELTGSRRGAFVAGLIFAFAPFRFDHYIHLELLWGFWTPLTLWALHRALDTVKFRYGALTGAFAVLQLTSCIYYGVFLSTALVIVTAGLLFMSKYRQPRRWIALVPGAIIAAAGGALYAQPYVDMARVLGDRGLRQVQGYSPEFHSYLAAPATNWLYGWTSSYWGGNERHLFVGLVAIVLVTVAIVRYRRTWVPVYTALLGVAVLICVGVNGPFYHLLYEWWPGYDGLRVPSRAGLIVVMAVALLAAGGLTVVMGWCRSDRMRTGAFAVTVGLVLMEYCNPLSGLQQLEHRTPYVYSWLAAQGDVVVLDLPVPRANELPGNEPTYQWLSTFHWRPLVNGYSGHYPKSYIRLLHTLRTFPDRRSIEALRAISVKFVIVHERGFSSRKFLALRMAMESTAELRPVARFQGVDGEGLYVAEIVDR